MHRGEIVEKIVKDSGFSIKNLAEKLSLSRNTVYNKFREKGLSYDVIIKIGDIIKYDFSNVFPEIKDNSSIGKNSHNNELWKLEHKYTKLLEKYNILLTFLVKIANSYNLDKLKNDINEFLTNNALYNTKDVDK